MEDDVYREIEADCARLTVRYGRYIDTYEDTKLLELFTEDATWQRPGHPLLVGRDQIREFLASRNRTVLTRHIVSNFMIEKIDGDQATGVSYATAFNAEGPGAHGMASRRAPFSVSEYLDRFLKTTNGWRISHRTTRYAFRGD